MKKKLSIMFFVACLMMALLAGTAQAATLESGEMGDLKWTYDDQGTLTISGTGKLERMENRWGYTYYPWFEDGFYSSVTKVVIKSGVTSIGDHAFDGLNNLREISIAGSVKSIGEGAFQYCDALEELTLYKGIETIGKYAFNCCGSLKNITIPSSVKTIDDYAFTSCWGLEKVTLYKGLETIGESAFSSNWSLTEFTIPGSVKSIGNEAFFNCNAMTKLTLNNGVQKIGKNAFCVCDSLTSVKIPASVKSIGQQAFGGISNLTSIKVSSDSEYFTSVNGILYNKAKTVLYCYPAGKKAETFTVPSTVKTIKADAFMGNASLKEVTIPASVKKIGDCAFHACTSLTNIKVNSKNTAFSSVDGVLFNKKQTTLVFYPQGITNGYYAVPSTVTKIGSNAFYNAFQLRVLYLREGVTTIGENAFDSSGLTQICLPKSLTDIEENAFSGCEWILTTVKYCGTKSQWKKIDFYNTPFSEYLPETTIIYSYKDVKPTKTVKIEAAHDIYSGYTALNWNAVDGVDAYFVYRATSKNGTYQKVAMVTEPCFESRDVTPGKTYYYKVKCASIKNAVGSFSNSVSGKNTLGAPYFDLALNKKGQPVLTLYDYYNDTDQVEKYVLYRSTSKNGTYTKVAEAEPTTNGESVVLTDTGAKSGKTYYYKVKTIAKSGSSVNSDYSDPAKIKVK